MEESMQKLMTVLLVSILGAATVRPEDRSGDLPVSLVERDGRVYDLEGGFMVRVPRSVAWAVLTDYDRIPKFVSSVKASRIQESQGGVFTVEQRLMGKVLIFTREASLRLAVREDGMKQISFQDGLHKDFEAYAGEWILENVSGGVRVTYRLSARPNFRVPAFATRRAFRNSVRQLLESVRAEMNRRGGP